MYDNLLLDAKNTIYRAAYASKKDFKITTYIIFKAMHMYINQFGPSKIHIFWDPRVTWRSEIFEEYKGTRDSSDVKDIIDGQVNLCAQLFDNLGVYQYFVDLQEADDLIYAFCDLHQGKKNIVISSDTDLKQVMKFECTKVYNPLTKKMVLKEELNPVYAKALVGDKADNIDGYKGVGKITAAKLLKKSESLREFLKSDKAKNSKGDIVNEALFLRNIKLIDLGRSPHLKNNIEYLDTIEKSQFNFPALIDILKEFKVSGGYLQDNLLSFKSKT